jgi:flagellar motor switch protein FliM
MSNEVKPQMARAIEKMVRRRVTSDESHPLPDSVFQNLAHGMWSTVRRLLGDEAEVLWKASSVCRFGDYCESIEANCVFGIFRIDEWDGQGLIRLDAQLVDAAVEGLLGGRVARATSEPRKHTIIDRAIAGRFIRIAVDEFARAFVRTDKTLGVLNAKLVKLETDPRLLTIARRDAMVANASFEVAVGSGECGGRYDLILPYSTLEPVRRKPLNALPPGRLRGDPPTARPLLAVLPEAPLTLHAVVDRLTLSFADMAQWREGTLIPLGVTADQATALYSQGEVDKGIGRKMFVGRLGASQGRKAVRVLEVIPGAAEEFGTEGQP